MLIKLRNSIGEFRLTPAKIVRRSWRTTRAVWAYSILTLISKLSWRSYTSPEHDTVINLTSYGARLRQVHLTLESIALGTLRPGKIILWLDPNDFDRVGEHKNIKRAIKRGLDVRQGDQRYRAHNKYFNYVVSKEPGYLVTADDDVFYPRDWLEQLWATFNNGQRAEVVAHALRQPRFVEGRLAPYIEWEPVSDSEGRVGRFSLGVSGVLFPDKLKELLHAEGEAFLQASPLADDVWINRCALAGHVPVRQCQKTSLTVIVVPFTQLSNLASENVLGGGNDKQIQASYSEEQQVFLQALYDN